VDLKQERLNKTLQGDFTQRLLTELSERIGLKQQAILFQNRRGYAPYLECEHCAWVPSCPNCDVSLTYHAGVAEIKCHYCGYTTPTPRLCPICGGTHIKTIGFGTEQLEEELGQLMPGVRIARMDLDTTRRKNSYSELIHQFSSHEIDVLIGTQMVSKGLDFDLVTLVGIFDIDRSIHFPDFRSRERAFQLLTQLSGRAGRRGLPGRVLIQTAIPTHPLLQKVVAGDYQGLYEQEIAERERYNYPPFSRLIKLTVKHEEKLLARQAAVALAQALSQEFGHQRVLGPEPPIIERLRNKFHQEVLLKLERQGLNMKLIKSQVLQQTNDILLQKAFKGLQIAIDVDPI
jgi:primosomal protein N' (replication factor Y) (superfamily II helicase)